MAAIHEIKTEFMLSLSEEERTQLLNLLEQTLQNKLVEEHRTETADFRKVVLGQEKTIENLISKLRRP